jgi:hypothetical protein
MQGHKITLSDYVAHKLIEALEHLQEDGCREAGALLSLPATRLWGHARQATCEHTQCLLQYKLRCAADTWRQSWGILFSSLH